MAKLDEADAIIICQVLIKDASQRHLQLGMHFTPLLWLVDEENEIALAIIPELVKSDI